MCSWAPAPKTLSWVSVVLQVAEIIEHLSGKKTLKVCRIAGQYGKPRPDLRAVGMREWVIGW